MKNHLIPTIIALFCILTGLSAQTPIWKFSKTATSGQINEMQTDSSGNIYLAGNFYTSTFSYQNKSVKGLNFQETSNLFLLKTTPTGKAIWLHSIYGTDSTCSIYYEKSLVTTSGDFVVGFSVTGTSLIHIGGYSFSIDQATENDFVAKFSKIGFLIWAKKITAKSALTMASLKLTDIAADTSGGIIISGWFAGSTVSIDAKSVNGPDSRTMMFLAKIGTSGNVDWMVNCPYDTSSKGGDIYPTKLAITKNDLICLAGYYTGYQTYYFGTDSLTNALGNDAFLARFSDNGKALWVHDFKGDLDDYPGNLVAGKDGSVYFDLLFNSDSIVVGSKLFKASSVNYDLILTHYDVSGNLMQAVSYPIQKPFVNLAGKNAYLSVDSSGDLIFCTNFYGNSLFSTPDSLINYKVGSSDLAFAKLDPSTLTPIWTDEITGPGDNNYDGIYLDEEGNIILTGTLYSNVTLTSFPITASASYGSPYLAFVKNDGTTDYIFSKNNSASNQILMQKTVSDKYGNVYVAGSYFGTGNVLGSDTLANSGSGGLFISRYCRTKTLNGIVKNQNGNIINSGYVKLYGYTWAQRSPVNDSVRIDANGNFVFNNVPLGKYIVKAVAQGAFQNEYMPTYYPSTEAWIDAQKIYVTLQSDPGIIDITLLPETIGGGQARLNGLVTQEDSSDFYKSAENFAKPSQEANVILAVRKNKKSTYQVYYITQTDENGNFSFENVADGTYDLWVEIPGLPSDGVYSVQVSNNQLISSLNYLVGEDKITKLGSPSYSAIPENITSSDISIGPNPANDLLLVNSKSTLSGKLVFYDLEGEIVLKKNIRQGINTINITSIPKGIYAVKIITDEETMIRKISILH